MPNWCENTLIVSGDKSEIKKFKAKAKAKNPALSLLLNNLYPMPSVANIFLKSGDFSLILLGLCCDGFYNFTCPGG